MGSYGGGWFSYVAQDPTYKPGVSRELLQRVWGFGKPYLGKILLLFATILAITGLSLLNPLIFRDLIDNALVNEDQTRLTWLALALIAIPILNGLIGVLQRKTSSEVGEGVIYDLRRALYNHMQRQSLRFFTQTRTGELMSRMNTDVVGAQSAITSTLVTIVSNTVSVIGTITIMLVLEWRLTLLAIAVLPGFILLARRIGDRLRQLRRRSMEVTAEMSSAMNETLNVSGALLVKLFGREQREQNRFSLHAGEVRDIGVQSAVISRWFFMGLGIATAIGTALVYWVGGWLVINTDTFTIGTIVAFSGYLGQLYGPLSALTNAPVEFAQSMVSFERVFEVLDLPIEIEEKEDAVVLPPAAGKIQFQNVTFTYDSAESGLEEIERFRMWGGSTAQVKRGKAKEGGEIHVERQSTSPALSDLNLLIQPGQLAALVGPSGAGKTTLTYMIPRLYDPTSGLICIDDYNIKDLTLKSLADNIGMVTQETYLFYDTVRTNLMYANPEATEAEMIAAARAANIHDFIAGLADGYDTVVGERGYRLSGGERQRIAIARVILKNPRILVLDEATSSLDSLSEALIQEALERVMEGRTSIVIAHRLSTILAADLILVMQNGRIVEQGTHDILLEQDGLYAELYHTQFANHSAEE
ncbi:MAG: ABC transporter ATP-binding protein [Chloroflexota bacterium]